MVHPQERAQNHLRQGLVLQVILTQQEKFYEALHTFPFPSLGIANDFQGARNTNNCLSITKSIFFHSFPYDIFKLGKREMSKTAQKEKQKPINLLPQEEFAASTFGRVLTWLVSSFRIIVILTELIVLASFFSRFWLDAKNTNLTEEINQKRAVIESFSDFENEFRRTQQRLKIFTDLTDNKILTADLVVKIASYLPSEINLKKLSFAKDEVKLTGTAPGETSIAQLLANLESDNQFQEVSLVQVETDKENEAMLNFGLKMTVKR
jgi:Tfp pilus assembly protein PilN